MKYPNDLVKNVKEMRVEISKLINDAMIIQTHSGHNPSDKIFAREMALVITKLEEAKMWAGKTLGKLGNELPEEYRDEC